MDLLPGTNSKKIYSLLSIGQRGVGKTVFLAGSYAELHPNNQNNNPQQLWFDCQDSDTQKTLENVLSYVARSGEYPPATMKLTNFELSLKQNSQGKTETLCHLRWWDTPGESCKLYNPAFQLMVLQSDGCCVFIDAHALVSNPNTDGLEDILQPVKSIAELVYQNGLRHPFALILTKFDLLASEPQIVQLLDERLQPLTSFLDEMKVNYKKFYSEIPIVSSPEGNSTIKPTQASVPVLWLVSEFTKANAPGSTESISSSENLASSTTQKTPAINLSPVTKKYILLLTLVLVIGSVGAFITFLVKNAGVNSDQQLNEPKPTQQK
jgi:GTPase SAR1 family protein